MESRIEALTKTIASGNRTLDKFKNIVPLHSQQEWFELHRFCTRIIKCELERRALLNMR